MHFRIRQRAGNTLCSCWHGRDGRKCVRAIHILLMFTKKISLGYSDGSTKAPLRCFWRIVAIHEASSRLSNLSSYTTNKVAMMAIQDNLYSMGPKLRTGRYYVVFLWNGSRDPRPIGLPS